MYGDRVAMLAPLASEDVPQAYDLCGVHASRTRAPRGWTLDDRRSPDEPGLAGVSSMSADLGGDHTVAVLAAALRAVPDPASSEDPAGIVVEAGRAPRQAQAGAPSPASAGVGEAGAPRVLVETPGMDVARRVTRPPLALRTRDRA